MSRIGRLSIALPPQVSVSYDNRIVTVTGPLGTLTQDINSKHLNVVIQDNTVQVVRDNDEKDTKAKHGLYRVLIANMVAGVVKPFTRSLIVNGVGFKCAVTGKKLVMNIGFSHTVEIIAPEGIEISCPTLTEILVKGISKEKVGHIAATIKSKRPVEPYHLYGIRYSEEVLVKKEGKTAGK